KQFTLRVQQQSRCTNSVRANDNHTRPLFVQVSLRVVVNCPAGTPIGRNRNFSDASLRFKYRSLSQCLWPIGDVGACPGLSSTTVPTLPAKIAGRPAIVRTRQEAEIENPPMPSQFIECLCGDSAGDAQGKWRQARRVDGIGRVPCKPSNAHLAIVSVVVAFEFLVSNWPVPCGSIQRFHAEVRPVKPQEFANPNDSCASDSIHHLDLWRILASCGNWIIFWPFSHVGIEGKLRPLHLCLIVRAARRVVARPSPVSLLQAHDTSPKFC